MNIPLVDLAAMHAEIRDDVRAGWERVFEKTAFVLGPDLAEFEKEYAAFSEVPHAIGVANGTDALELALRAVGVGPGDEVVLPANTFIASALAVARAGATPVLVDAVEDTMLIDIEQAKAAVNEKTKAIMPVHLTGQMADVEALLDTGVEIVEDAAQSQGATRNGKQSVSAARIAGTSFFPGKNLGAYGDAGAVITNDDSLARTVRNLRNYGSDVKYHHPETGFNSRMDTLQAVVLREKIKRLPAWNDMRRAAAARYDELLADVDGVTLPTTAPGNVHVWHLYVVRVAERDRVLSELQQAGVGAGIHYPVPVHLQGAFAHLGHKAGDFPVTEKLAESMLTLPLFPHISSEQQSYVAQTLRDAVRP